MQKLISLLMIPFCFGIFLTPQDDESNLEKGRSSTAITQNEIVTPEFLWSLGRVQMEGVSPDQKMVVYSVTHTNLPLDSNYTHFFMLPADGVGATSQIDLPPNAKNLRFHPAGKHLLFLKSDTLYAYSLSDKLFERVSAFPVGEYNFSKDGRAIVFTQKVKYGKIAKDIYPELTKSEAKIFDNLGYRHLDDGYDDGFRANVFVANWQPGMELGAGKNIMENEPFHAHHISCSNDGRYILYDAKKVSANEQTLGTDTDVFLYDSQTDQTRNLSHGMRGYDQDAAFSPDNTAIVWNSMKTAGYETDRNRIMAFNLSAGMLREITANFDFNAHNPKWRSNNTLVFSTEQGGTVQLYTAALDGQIRPITSGAHTVDRFFLTDGSVFYSKSSYEKPAEVYKTELADGKTSQCTFVNGEAMKTVKLGKSEERFTQTFDGKKLQSWVIYPPDFDPKKKYPVVLYCQGGPQSPLTSAWGLRWSMQLIAAQGYIVIAPNRRGTLGFGTEWTEEVSQNWGDKPMKDLLSAIDDLAKEPYVDKDRMGAVGGSFGGYSVFWLAGNHQKRFKCFISHCGLFNLETFYMTTDELFFARYDLGEPSWQNPNNPSFRQYSPHLYVKNWDTPILIFQGALDYRVPEGEGLQAFQAAQLKGIPSRMVYFPDEAHAVRKPQNSVLWQQEFIRWLNLYLQ